MALTICPRHRDNYALVVQPNSLRCPSRMQGSSSDSAKGDHLIYSQSVFLFHLDPVSELSKINNGQHMRVSVAATSSHVKKERGKGMCTK